MVLFDFVVDVVVVRIIIVTAVVGDGFVISSCGRCGVVPFHIVVVVVVVCTVVVRIVVVVVICIVVVIVAVVVCIVIVVAVVFVVHVICRCCWS